MEIITRAEARERGLRFFFTGKPCVRGHTALRYTSFGACVGCNSYRLQRFHSRHPEARKAYGKTYRSKHPGKQGAYYRSRPKKALILSARARAKELCLPFDITEADIDIPEFCPVLGLKLMKSRGGGPLDRSPTLDRIVPELGYIVGNVRVISWRANTLKRDASVEELRAVLKDLEAQHV